MPSDVVEPFSIVGDVHPGRTDLVAEFALANLAQFLLDGFGPLFIASRLGDFEFVKALTDRSHDCCVIGSVRMHSSLLRLRVCGKVRITSRIVS